MAEVILPGEEENNVPVLPEIVLEMPGINSKVIEVIFDPLNTKKTTVINTSESFFTTDTDAWLEFTATGLTNATGTYSLVLRNRNDGSVFQHVGDMVDGKAYYKIPAQEIRHAGRWIGQMYVTLENGQTTAAQFSFRVDGHILDGKDVRETVVEDFQTLMAQLQGVKGQAEIDLADLKADLSLSTAEAEQLLADTQELKLIYDELLETGVLQTNINEKLTELETTYAPRLTTNEQSVVSLTAQLQHKAEKTQADSLQMQVNNIVLQGTSGDSSAEVAQAKVDMYGNNFTTVKDHLDSTEQSVSGSVDKKYQYLWQIGSLSSGNLVANTNRIVNKDVQFALDDLIVSTTDFSVYRFGIHLYSDSIGSDHVDRGWQYSDFTIKKGSYFRIVGARISEVAISNVREGIFNNLSISSTSTLNNIKKLVDSQNYEIYAFGSDELEIGNINAGNNQTNDYRIRTKKRIDVYKDTIIKVDVSNTLYIFSVSIYNKDTKLYELTSGWLNPPAVYKVPYNCQIRILAFRSDNAIMTNADILALNKNIKVQLTQQSTHFYATDLKIENALETITSDLSELTVKPLSKKTMSYQDDYSYSEYRGKDTTFWTTHINQNKFDGTVNYPKVRLTAEHIDDPNTKSVQQYVASNQHDLVINAGIFNMGTNISDGYLIIDGEIVQDKLSTTHMYQHTLAVMQDGTLTSFEESVSPTELLALGVQQAVVGFIPIIIDGEIPNDDFLKICPHSKIKNPRQIIGQYPNGDYIIFTCDGRREGEAGMTLREAAEIMQKLGVSFAYNLDGGGSTQTFVSKKRINNLIENRLVPNVLVF